MALLKDVTMSTGVVLGYHRISAIVKNRNNITLVVDSYVSESFRNSELELFELKATAEAEMLREYILTAKDQATLTNEEKAELEKIEANTARRTELMIAYNESYGFHAREKSYEVTEAVTDLSFIQGYALLKTFPEFTDAVDM